MMTEKDNSHSEIQPFNRCDFLLSKRNNSVVVIVPQQLPKDNNLTLRLDGHNIIFRSGDEDYTKVKVFDRSVIDRLAEHQQVGIIEADNGKPQFAAYITAVAHIEQAADNDNPV